MIQLRVYWRMLARSTVEVTLAQGRGTVTISHHNIFYVYYV